MRAARMLAIRRYLRTGDSDPLHAAWNGGVFEAVRRAREDLESALIEEVKSRAFGKRSRRLPRGLDLRSFTRAKVEPMVRGLLRDADLVAPHEVSRQLAVDDPAEDGRHSALLPSLPPLPPPLGGAAPF